MAHYNGSFTAWLVMFWLQSINYTTFVTFSESPHNQSFQIDRVITILVASLTLWPTCELFLRMQTWSKYDRVVKVLSLY